MKLRIFLIIFFFINIFILLNILLTPKYATSLVEGGMIREYYNSSKDHDVIFIGDCEVYANFSPPVLYEETGIKSYIRGSSQQLIWQSYYILKETLKYETPRIIVFNVNAMRYDKPVSESYNHLTADYMKWSLEKINLINASMTKKENIWYYLLPITRYHSRYKELSKEDFQYFFRKKTNTFNGFLINKNIKPVTTLPTKRALSNYNFSQENYDYLKKILQLCQENNIELILIKAPSLYPFWYEEYDEQITKFAQENNLDYYNLINQASTIGLDYTTDTYDAGLHLNLYGATKLSKYFAHLLSDNYDLTNYQGDSYYDNLLLSYQEAIEKTE